MADDGTVTVAAVEFTETSPNIIFCVGDAADTLERMFMPGADMLDVVSVDAKNATTNDGNVAAIDSVRVVTELPFE